MELGVRLVVNGEGLRRIGRVTQSICALLGYLGSENVRGLNKVIEESASVSHRCPIVSAL